MIKFVILDVYPNKKHRLIKDTAGGYGTGNDFGNTFFSRLVYGRLFTKGYTPPYASIIFEKIRFSELKPKFVNPSENPNCIYFC